MAEFRYLNPTTVRRKRVSDKLSRSSIKSSSSRIGALRKAERASERASVAKESAREWSSIRRGISGRILSLFRVSILKSLDGKPTNFHIFQELGFSRDELISHIGKLLEEYEYHCPVCGCELTWKTLTIDHVVPRRTASSVDELLALFRLSNTAILCRPCNSKKGGKIPQSSPSITI